MADCGSDGQPEEIDEFAMFRARALGAESEYLLMHQASRRGSPRADTRRAHSSSASVADPATAADAGQPISRSGSGHRRHGTGQGSRSRRAAHGVEQPDDAYNGTRDQLPGDAAEAGVITPESNMSLSQVRKRAVAGRQQQQTDQRTESSASGGHQKMLLSPCSFDDDNNDLNDGQRFLEVNRSRSHDSNPFRNSMISLVHCIELRQTPTKYDPCGHRPVWEFYCCLFAYQMKMANLEETYEKMICFQTLLF